MPYSEWTKHDKKVARVEFEKALNREKKTFVAEVRARAGAVQTIDEVWQLGEDIRNKARDIDERYDFRGSVLTFVMANLVRGGLISMDDLADLHDEKRTMIARLSNGTFFTNSSPDEQETNDDAQAGT